MEQMITSTAVVLTDRPARYAKQLVSHLSRRSPGTWDEVQETGTIRFDGGTARLVAVAEGLRLELATERALVDRLEDVIGRHLVRFATRDRLDVSWRRSDGSTGSSQSSSDQPDETGRDHDRQH